MTMPWYSSVAHNTGSHGLHMTNEDPSSVLRQGSAAWNAWRARNPGSVTFNRPSWYDSPGKGGNRVDFSGMNLSGIVVAGAFAEGLNLQGALIEGSTFDEGDFSWANFQGAKFRDTRFNKTILTNANFDGATFVNCNLNRVNLVGASFRVEEITETVVYGIAAWDLTTSDEAKQSKLVIERTYGFYSDLIGAGSIPVMVDDIELAQFVHYLMNHKKLRDALNVLNDRGVLLLGRFKGGGLERLYAFREWLQRNGYMAMIFDFERPDNLSLTEAVVTMAGLSKFIVVDLSGSSVPHELQAIVSGIKKPILAFGDAYALFPDLADQTTLLTIEPGVNLEDGFQAKLPELERLHSLRLEQLAKRYRTDEPQPSN